MARVLRVSARSTQFRVEQQVVDAHLRYHRPHTRLRECDARRHEGHRRYDHLGGGVAERFRTNSPARCRALVQEEVASAQPRRGCINFRSSSWHSGPYPSQPDSSAASARWRPASATHVRKSGTGTFPVGALMVRERKPPVFCPLRLVRNDRDAARPGAASLRASIQVDQPRRAAIVSAMNAGSDYASATDDRGLQREPVAFDHGHPNQFQPQYCEREVAHRDASVDRDAGIAGREKAAITNELPRIDHHPATRSSARPRRPCSSRSRRRTRRPL